MDHAHRGQISTGLQPADAPGRKQRAILLGALLAIVTGIAYAPSLPGGFLWDDPSYVVNNPALRSARGLWLMWTNIFSLPQWYPLVHTTYWIEYHLVGLHPLLYRIDNLILHIATALLLWRLLWTLRIPGAYLAAFVFAVHPVHVESVAWITERKNTLSGLFYIAAFLCYWRWRLDQGGSHEPARPGSNIQPVGSNRTSRLYLAALVLFVCALLSKTVTATFPAAVLVVIWWKTGRVTWRDVRPLIPLLVLGAIMGTVTSYLERNHVGARGAEWNYAPTITGELAARVLIAGRAAWFYFGHLIWPYPLAFFYERWSIDPAIGWQWAFPVAAVIVIAVLALAAGRIGRGPLACALLFVGTLFPALGFFNVYPHRYSFVADHFQHLASIAVTTGICAGLVQLMRKLSGSATPRAAICAVAIPIVAILTTLTFLQSRVYRSAEALWLDTARKSPNAWVAYTNLGQIAADAGRMDQAIDYHHKALELAPDVADTWFNFANVCARQQRWDQAYDAFHRAAELAAKNQKTSTVFLNSTLAMAQIAYQQRHDAPAAEKLFKQALEAAADYPPAHVKYAVFLDKVGRVDQAFEHYVTATELDPTDFDARYNLGTLLIKLGQPREAVEQLSAAAYLQPKNPAAWTNLGSALLQAGDRGGAAKAFRHALAINPDLEPARRGLQAATR